MNKLVLTIAVLFISCGSPNQVRDIEFSVPVDSVYVFIDSTFMDTVVIQEIQEELTIAQEKLTKSVSVKSSKNIKKEDPLIRRTDSIVRALDKRVIEVMDSLQEFRLLKK